MIQSAPLNIGLAAGFARMDGDTLRLFQNRYECLGLHMALADTARPAEYPYEPVLVVFRILGGKHGKPRFQALDVQRMPANAIPRNAAKAWTRCKSFRRHSLELEAAAEKLSFYPFMRSEDGNESPLDPAIAATLTDRPVWPAWLQALIERHELVAEMFDYRQRYSSAAMLGDWLGTGHLLRGTFEKGERFMETGDGANFVWADFGLGGNMALEDAVTVLLPSPIQGFARLRRLTLDRKELHVTLLTRLIFTGHGALDSEMGHLVLNGQAIYQPSSLDMEAVAPAAATA